MPVAPVVETLGARVTDLDLARLQFASTSIYHFLFVPVTIGLGFLVAVLHTMWFRSGNPDHKRLTRFFGTLLLINVAVGVVTGLIQEFQFGMNWSAYSRFVGDVFGAPLAMEGLAAFFLESTFIGLWVFGWNVLPPKLHLLTVWLVAAGAAGSAAFIMAANSWMQHPVGYTVDQATGRPELSDIGAVMTNPVFLWGYAHVLTASLVTGSVLMLAVSAWYLRRGTARGGVHALGEGLDRRAAALDLPGAGRRQPPRRHRGDVPADEDLRGRGAVGDVPAVLVLRVPDRRRQQRPEPHQDHRDPAPALHPGDGHVER